MQSQAFSPTSRLFLTAYTLVTGVLPRGWELADLAPMSQIRALPPSSVEQLRSGVSISSFPQAVVEVVSNSVDAGMLRGSGCLDSFARTCVRCVCAAKTTCKPQMIFPCPAGARAILLQLDVGQQGVASFSCTDDGLGINEVDLQQVGIRWGEVGGEQIGHPVPTLKWLCRLTHRYHTSKHYPTAQGVTTLGFRGEALASIADSCAVITITSRAVRSFVTFCKVISPAGVVKCGPTLPGAVPHHQHGTVVSVSGFLSNQPVRQRQCIASR